MRNLINTFRVVALVSILAPLLCSTALAQSLKGSAATMKKQNQAAINYGYTFLETSQAVNSFVESGYLVRISPNRYLEIHNVSYPYARPAVKVFAERLSNQYYSACGEKLTVTSLTRPLNKQPANASDSSVHPAGMAIDLRIPSSRKCRAWLESTLLSLESTDVLDVTREKNPPHYHVAVFTETYEQYIANLGKNTREYTVRRGDSLSKIASSSGSSIASLRAANNLSGDLINVGQTLQIPATTADIAAITTSASKASTEKAAAVESNQIAAVNQVTTHLVRRGETLWRIASLYGTSVNNIRMENGLSDDMLQVGQELRLNMTNR